jgi:hypothetical protein
VSLHLQALLKTFILTSTLLATPPRRGQTPRSSPRGSSSGRITPSEHSTTSPLTHRTIDTYHPPTRRGNQPPASDPKSSTSNLLRYSSLKSSFSRVTDRSDAELLAYADWRCDTTRKLNEYRHANISFHRPRRHRIRPAGRSASSHVRPWPNRWPRLCPAARSPRTRRTSSEHP